MFCDSIYQDRPIYTIKIDILFVYPAKLCYTPDIFSYIFCHIFMKNTISSHFFLGLGTPSLHIFQGAYSTACANGSELEAWQMLPGMVVKCYTLDKPFFKCPYALKILI